MKTIVSYLCGVLLLFSVSENYAQTFDWAIRAGSADYDFANSMVKDDQGNLYIVGNAGANSQFGSFTTLNAGAFFAKLDPSGNFLFVKIFDSTQCRSISINNYNQILIGATTEASTFDGTPFVNPSGSLNSGIAALFDTGGNKIWLRVFDCVSYVVSVENNGPSNFFVGGTCPPNALIGSINLANQAYSTFIASLDSSGTFTMASAISTNSTSAPKLTSDNNGNVFVIAEYMSPTFLSNGQTYATISGQSGLFVAKADAGGNLLWSKNIEGNNLMMSSSGLQFLTNHAIVSAVSFYDSLMVDGSTLHSGTDTVWTTLISFDTTGAINWNNSFVGNVPNTLAAADSGGFYYTASPMLNMFDTLTINNFSVFCQPGYKGIYLIKFNSTGDPLWGKTINSQHLGGHCCESIQGIVNGTNDDIYVTGFYYGEALFDNITLPCYQIGNICSPYEIFVAHLINLPLNSNEDLLLNNGLKIYPNPTADRLQIELKTNVYGSKKIHIFNTQGQLVSTKTFSGNVAEVDISSLSTGAFLIRIETEIDNYYKIIVKSPE